MGSTAEQPWSVAVVSKHLADWIGRLGHVWIEGQLSEVKIRPGSSLVFMRLRDVTSEVSLSLVAPIGVVKSVEPPLAEGARVVVHAGVQFWSKRGELHLRARQIRAVGLGELLARLEQLRKLLAAEGVFAPERKQPLPFLPTAVGLICGRNSEAERDVVRNAQQRWPGMRFEIREVAVQGPSAVAEVTRALRELDQIADVDVIVITRGGGSVEDLLPFSDEGLVRAVSAATTPVVSAIGHERDRPILDEVADVRASTPTDAARRIVPDLQEEVAGIDRARQLLRTAGLGQLRQHQREIAMLRSSTGLQAMATRVAQEAHQGQRLRAELRRAMASHLDAASMAIDNLRHRLRALSPGATLARGYAIAVTTGGTVISDPAQVALGESFQVRLAGGTIAAERVDSAEPSGDASAVDIPPGRNTSRHEQRPSE